MVTAMTEQSETIPTAAQRVSAFLTRMRVLTGGDHGAVAECLTALGLPTKPSTITRIESGRQDANIDQVLLLALFETGYGLRDMLQVPFKIADVIIETEKERDRLLLGWTLQAALARRAPAVDKAEAPKRPRASYKAVGVSGAERVSILVDNTLIDRRYRQIAEELGVAVADVKTATHELYGGGVYRVINDRTLDRLSKDDPQPELGSATWQAYRSHAVRAVTREIGEHLRARA